MTRSGRVIFPWTPEEAGILKTNDQTNNSKINLLVLPSSLLTNRVPWEADHAVPNDQLAKGVNTLSVSASVSLSPSLCV